MKSYVQLVSGTSKLFQPRDHITRPLSFFKQPACLECCSRLLQMQECLGQIAVITAQQSPFLMGASHLQQTRAGTESLEPGSHMTSATHDGPALLQCALHLSTQNVHHCEVAIAEGICGKMVCFQRLLNCLYSNFILTASSADDTQVANGIDIFCPIGSSF